MTSEELYNEVILSLNIKSMPSLYKAVMEECCENVVENPQQITDKNTLISSTQVAFMVCMKSLKAIVQAGLEHADTITLNYRGQTFLIDKSHIILNA
jgi:hypothetical protein